MTKTILSPWGDDAATILVDGESFPATIISRASNGQSLTLRLDVAERTPDGYVFSSNPRGKQYRVFWRKNGYFNGSDPVTLGARDRSRPGR